MLYWSLITIQIILLLSAFIICSRMLYILRSFHKTYRPSNVNHKQIVPYVPTPRSIIKTIAKEINSGQRVIDLGSGTGKMALLLAKYTAPDVIINGIEISPLLYAISIVRKLFSPNKKRVHFTRGDWNSVNLGDYDVVVVFLNRRGVAALMPKFIDELRTGSRVISYMFALLPDEHFIDISKDPKIFVYRKV